MELLKILLEISLNKKYKFWFKDGKYAVIYAKTEEEAKANLDKADIDNIKKIEELQ